TFRLPGLSTGALLLQTDLVAPGQGTVTVRVQSLTNAAMTASATATVTATVTAVPEPEPVPVPPVLPAVIPTPPTAPATPTLLLRPGTVVEGTKPLLPVAGIGFTRASVVLLRVLVGRRVLLRKLATIFVNGTLLRARIPLWLPAPVGARRWTLDEGQPVFISV